MPQHPQTPDGWSPQAGHRSCGRNLSAAGHQANKLILTKACVSVPEAVLTERPYRVNRFRRSAKPDLLPALASWQPIGPVARFGPVADLRQAQRCYRHSIRSW